MMRVLFTVFLITVVIAGGITLAPMLLAVIGETLFVMFAMTLHLLGVV